jgi:hypothetical protein
VQLALVQLQLALELLQVQVQRFGRLLPAGQLLP